MLVSWVAGPAQVCTDKVHYIQLKQASTPKTYSTMPQMFVGITKVANGDNSSGANAQLQLTLCCLAVHGGTSAHMTMQVYPDRQAWGCSGSPALSADTRYERQLVESSQEHACTHEAWELTLR